LTTWRAIGASDCTAHAWSLVVIECAPKWPGKEPAPRYFGKFNSQVEAERWIKAHHWLTEQPPELEWARHYSSSAPTTFPFDGFTKCTRVQMVQDTGRAVRVTISLRACARVEIIDEFDREWNACGHWRRGCGTKIAANDYGLTAIAARSWPQRTRLLVAIDPRLPNFLAEQKQHRARYQYPLRRPCVKFVAIDLAEIRDGRPARPAG
jgi:hypothetical protein